MCAYELPVASADQIRLVLGAASWGSIAGTGRKQGYAERMLRHMGADLRVNPEGGSHKACKPQTLAGLITVPGDLSSAAFWLILAR